jgi:hypothetical protein
MLLCNLGLWQHFKLTRYCNAARLLKELVLLPSKTTQRDPIILHVAKASTKYVLLAVPYE